MNSEKLDIDILIRRIREEAAKLKLQTDDMHYPHPENSSIKLHRANTIEDQGISHSAESKLPDQSKTGSYLLSDFLPYHGNNFVERCYRLILGRPPDPNGRSHFSKHLMEGKMTKVEILARIRYSPEGRRKGIKVKGLIFHVLFTLLFKIPAIGSFLKVICHVASLDRAFKNMQILEEDYFDWRSNLTESLNNEFHKLQIKYTALQSDLEALKKEALGFNILKSKHRALQLEVQTVIDRIYRTLSLPSNHLLDLLEHNFKDLPAYVYSSIQDKFKYPDKDSSDINLVYLPYVKKAMSDCSSTTIIDLGCGQGRWAKRMSSKGVNTIAIDKYRSINTFSNSNLIFKHHDIFKFLLDREKDSASVITAFHLIEHLNSDFLIYLMALCNKVLKKNGLVIFETPNPRNILVLSDFYRDPTHVRPIFPDTIELMGKTVGYESSKCFFVDHANSELIDTEKVRFDTIEDYIKVPRDFAWFGIK